MFWVLFLINAFLALYTTNAQSCDDDFAKTNASIVFTASPTFTDNFIWTLIQVPGSEAQEDNVVVSGTWTGGEVNVCIECDKQYVVKVASLQGNTPVGQVSVTLISETIVGSVSGTSPVSQTTISIPCVCKPSSYRVDLIVEHDPGQPEGSLVWTIHQPNVAGVFFSGNSNSNQLMCLPCDTPYYISALHCRNTRTCSSYPFKLLEQGTTSILFQADASDQVRTYLYNNDCSFWSQPTSSPTSAPSFIN